MARTPEQVARAERVLNLWYERASAGDPQIGHLAADLGMTRAAVERILKAARNQGDERAIISRRSRAAGRPPVAHKVVKPRVHNFQFSTAEEILARAGTRPPCWHLCGDHVVDGEEWRPAIGPAGYLISSLGRVRGRNGQILRTGAHQGEYRRIRLGNNDPDQKFFLVHTLVAAAFIGPRPEGMHINHKDGVQYHNAPSNLEYVTPGENTRHANEVLRVYRPRGSRVNTAKLTEAQALEVLAKYADGGVSQYELARQYGVTQSGIQSLVSGRTWKHAAQDLAAPPVTGRWKHRDAA